MVASFGFVPFSWETFYLTCQVRPCSGPSWCFKVQRVLQALFHLKGTAAFCTHTVWDKKGTCEHEAKWRQKIRTVNHSLTYIQPIKNSHIQEMCLCAELILSMTLENVHLTTGTVLRTYVALKKRFSIYKSFPIYNTLCPKWTFGLTGHQVDWDICLILHFM